MKIIKYYVDHIAEEIEDAKEYAEKAIECKVKGNSSDATKFKEMAHDELKHANYLHEMAVREINELSKVYTPPASMQDVWDKAHREFIEKTAWVKQMLDM